MKILIIDPTIKNVPTLYQQLSAGHYEISGIVTDASKAIQSIATAPPELLVIGADINSIQSVADILNYIHQSHPGLPSIVVADEFQQDLVKELELPQPTAYLIKPYTLKTLFAMIESAMKESISTAGVQDELFLKTGTKYERLNLQQLLYAKANGKYTELHFAFGKRLMRISLTNFIKEKINIDLLRVHKSYAVNTTAISSYKSDEVEVGEAHIPIGRFFKDNVQHFLKKNTLLLSINHRM